MSDLEQNLLEQGETEEKEAPPENVFWVKFQLAVSMAFWTSFFFAPVVLPSVHQWFFVDMGLPQLLGSPDFESYWPNTVQLIVFTVYFSTGSTVNLAWQGLAGTVCAGLNQVFMGILFPLGGKCLKMGAYSGSGIRGFCEEFADPNYGTFEWFVWFDVFFFLFLLLSSNAKENTMKFGMSWHITYMMAFMSSNGYQPSHAVNITTVVGVMLAILITLVPSKTRNGLLFKQMVANNLEGHPKRITDKMRTISRGTIQFMLRDKPTDTDSRYHYKVDKVAIEQQVDELSGMANSMCNDQSVSWWEGWLYVTTGGPKAVKEFRSVRTHCGIFSEAFADEMGGFDDVAYLMKKAVSCIEASNYKFMDEEDLMQLSTERRELAGYLKNLNDATFKLLDLLSDWKSAPMVVDSDTGSVDIDDGEIKALRQDIKEKFDQLFMFYRQWMIEHPVQSVSRKMMRSNMAMFVFSVLQLSQEADQLSEKVIEKYRHNATLTEAKLSEQTAWEVFEEFKSTFISDGKTPALLKALTDGDKRSFVFRNLVSIGLCFAIGNLLQGNVFATPFNPLLAGTLAVLISHFPGSAFYKNLMRLLGLAIGNTLPIIMLAPVTLCGEWKAVVHLIMFFLFELYFGLMYYTSPEWAYIGCIVAGFGCYSFTTETWSETTFSAGYCKIGQVTAAITVQIIVDIIDTAIRKKFPQQVVVDNMVVITEKTVKIFQLFLMRFQGHESKSTDELMKTIKTLVGEAKALMASQEQLVSECESKTIMIAGPSPPFKLDLYKGVLAAIENILGDADALCLVDEFSHTVGTEAGAWYEENYSEYWSQVISNMRQTFDTVMKILTLKDDSPVPKKDVKVCLLEEPDGEGQQAGSLRMSVVKGVVSDTLAHVLEIEHLCCASGSLEFQI